VKSNRTSHHIVNRQNYGIDLSPNLIFITGHIS